MTAPSASPGTVLVFGGAVMDFVRTGETWAARGGGSGWNVARALAKLGTPCEFVGTLGNDDFARDFVREAASLGVGLRFVGRVDAPTALSVVHDPEAGKYAFYAQGCADSHFLGVPEEAWEGAVAAYFGGVTLLRAEGFLGAAREARARGLTVVYDPNFRPAHAEAYRAVFPEYLKCARILKVGEDDLAGLAPLPSLAGVTVLKTLGGRGAELDGRAHPGFAVEVADTVGAGDASIAGLIHARLADHPDPLAFALAAGAAACRVAGAHAPTLREVQEILEVKI